MVGSTSSTSSNPKLSRLTNNKILVGLFSGSIPLLNSVNFMEWTYILFYLFTVPEVLNTTRETNDVRIKKCAVVCVCVSDRVSEEESSK